MRDYQIRRHNSSLSNGYVFRGHPRSTPPLLWIVAVIIMGGAAFILWQFNSIQPMVLAMIGVVHTPTPTALQAARAGDLAFWQGALTPAIENYRHAVRLAPNNVDIRYELVRMLIYRSFDDERNLADVDEAKRIAAETLEIAPQNPRSLTLNCFALMRAGNSEEASQLCNQAIALTPRDPNAYAYLAQAYYDLGRLDVAQEAARQALELNPQSIEANTAFGFIMVSQRRTETAIQYFMRAAAVNQRLEFPYFNLAAVALSAALNQGDEALYQTAIRAYDSVLAMNKRSVKAYTSLCRAYMARGERNLARDNCVTATDLDTSYTVAWRWLGMVNYQTMEYEQATAAYDRCVEQERDRPTAARQWECWVYGGLSWLQRGNCVRALPLFEDVLNWTRSAKAIELVNTGIRLCTNQLRPTRIPSTPGGPPTM